MADLGVLAQIPGLAGYLQQKAMNEGQTSQNLQQATGAMGILSQIAAQQKAKQEMARDEQLRGALSASGGDLNKAMEAAIQSGNLAGAAKLAPLIKLKQDQGIEGMPQIVQLNVLRDRARAAGNNSLADSIDRQINVNQSTEKSASQENTNFLLDVQKRVQAGEQVSPIEINKAKIIHAQMTAPKIDLATGARSQADFGIGLDPNRNFGFTSGPTVTGAFPTEDMAKNAAIDAVASGRNVAFKGPVPATPQQGMAEFNAAPDTLGTYGGQPTLPTAPAPVMPQVVVTPGKPKAVPYSPIAKLNADLTNGLIDSEQHAQALQAIQDAAKMKSDAIGNGNVKATAAMVASGMPIAQAVPGFGQAAAAERRAVRDAAINQIKESTGMTDVQAGEELANRQIDFAAGKRSITQLNTMLGATRQAVDQLDFNVKQVSKAMAKLGGGGLKDLSPVINAIARGEQKWTGDPAYSELYYYMFASGQESARILSGGQASVAQLYQGAAEEARKWASANMTTPKAWNEGVAPAMLAEGHERLKTYERAIEKQRISNSGSAPQATNPSVSTKVTTPDGTVIKFTSAAGADAFKKKHGFQ